MTYPHGTPARYTKGRCRCPACTDAVRLYAAERRRHIAYGTWNRLTDAEPARQHIRALQAAGIGWQRIATHAGLSRGAIQGLLYTRGAGRPPTAKIRPTTAARILALRAENLLADGAYTDATGTRRRLQALTARGWSAAELGRRLGIAATNMHPLYNTTRPRIEAATVRAVRQLYNQLWDQPPPENTRHQKIAATKSRQRAAAAGWAPPLAWDDIDDPEARPTGVRRTA